MLHGIALRSRSVRFALTVACLVVTNQAMAQRAWSPPVVVSASGQPSRSPRLAMDGSGNSITTWIREQASGPVTRQAQAARHTSTGLWLQPVSLYSPATSWAVPGESTDIALNAAGRGAAVWVRATGSGVADCTLQAAAFNGTSWGAPLTLVSPSVAGVTRPRVGVDSDGNAIAVWVQTLSGFAVVRASRYTTGGTWSAPVTLSDAAENVSDGPELGVDDTGNAVAAWVSATAGVPTLHAAQFGEVANAWTMPETVGVVDRTPTVIRLALMRAGTAAFVAYRAYDGANNVLRASRLETASDTWSAPVRVSAAGQDIVDLDIAVDEQGRAIAVWNRFDGTRRTVASARYNNGMWGAAEPRSTGSDTDDVAIDTDAAGNAVAVWTRIESGASRVQAAAFAVATSTWTQAIDVTQSGQARAPQVRLHTDGAAVTVWQDGDTSPTIQSSRYVLASAPQLQPASVSGPEVNLAWSAGSGAPPVGYTVVASGTPGGAPAIWFPVGTSTALAVTAQPGAYYVRVLALVNGQEVSSNEIEVVVGVGPAPTPPQSFTATAAGNIVSLSWSQPVNANIAPVITYYVGAGSAEGTSNLAFFPVGTQTSFVSGPVPNGSYWIRVRAQSAGGIGEPSPDIRVIVGPPPPGAPVLSGGATGPGAVQLQWTVAPAPGVPVTGYELRAGTASGLSNVAVFTLPAGALAFSTTGVPPGNYYVRVVALSSAGPGTPSNEVVVTVQ